MSSELFFVKDENDIDCIMKSRALQKIITQMCSSDYPLINDKCFNHKGENTSSPTLPPHKKTKKSTDEILSDLGHFSNKLFKLKAPPEPVRPSKDDAKNEKEGFNYSCYSKAHGPSADASYRNKNIIKLSQIIGDLVLIHPELDPRVFYTEELMNWRNMDSK